MISRRRVPIAMAILLAVAAAPAMLSAQNSELPLGEGQNLHQEVAKLTAVLRSDAELFDKVMACKRLGVIGDKEAVPALASLLSDEKLGHYARYGLEPIPDPAVDVALRQAMTKLKGRLLVGVINSIGNRKEAGATDGLVALLKDSDTEVATAAAAALGRLGSSRAAQVLQRALAAAEEPLRTPFADACLACAEGLADKGQKEEALTLFDTLRKAELPKYIRGAATHWAIITRGADGVELLAEQLQSDDKDMFSVGLRASDLLTGSEVTKTLVGALDGLSPDRKALVLGNLAGRGDPTAQPALLEAATSGRGQVRIAAIRGLKELGTPPAGQVLLDAARADDPQVVQAARASLIGLADQSIDRDLVALLNEGKEENLRLWIELAGARRIAAAVPALLEAADNPQAEIRLDAVMALGTTIQSKDLPQLTSRVIKPKSPQDAIAAQMALKAASIRMPDRDECAEKLASCLPQVSIETKTFLFELLGTVGGAKALDVVASAARSSDAEIQDLATRVLGQWMSPDAAPELLELAQTLSDNRFKIRAMRAYIRIPRQLSLPAEEKLAMCRKAMRVAWRTDEKKLVMDVLARTPSPASLAMAVESLKDPSIKGPASRAAVFIAEKIVPTNPTAAAKAMVQVLQAGPNQDLAGRAKMVSVRAKRAAGK